MEDPKSAAKKTPGEGFSGKKLCGKESTGKKLEEEGTLGRKTGKRKGEVGGRNDETGKKVLHWKKARGLSASRDQLLGNSEDEEKRKELGISEKAVRKRKVQGQGIDGISRRLGKFSKLGHGSI